jgi:hypothetical protein
MIGPWMIAKMVATPISRPTHASADIDVKEDTPDGLCIQAQSWQ